MIRGLFRCYFRTLSNHDPGQRLFRYVEQRSIKDIPTKTKPHELDGHIIESLELLSPKFARAMIKKHIKVGSY